MTRGEAGAWGRAGEEVGEGQHGILAGWEDRGSGGRFEGERGQGEGDGGCTGVKQAVANGHGLSTEGGHLQ